MTEWFARPVLHVSSVEAALRFYVDRLGFTVPWTNKSCGRKQLTAGDARNRSCMLVEDRRQSKGGSA